MARTKIGEAIEKGLIPIIIVALAIFIFGGKLVWEIASNFKVIVYIVGGIIGLKILSLLGFKK